jgi:transposase
MSGEADMWAAAVEQALRAGCNPLVETRRNDMGGCTPSEAANEWRFLTAPHGPWADSRKHICEMCGVEPDLLRNEALRRGASRQAVLGLRHEARREEAKKPHIGTAIGKNPSPAIIARNAALAADYAGGMMIREMAVKYAPLSADTIAKIANQLGAKRPPGFMKAVGAVGVAARAAKTDALHAEALRMIDAGASREEVAKATGMSKRTIRIVIGARNRAGSAVDARGGARAAGGGEVLSVSPFHAQNMQESSP